MVPCAGDAGINSDGVDAKRSQRANARLHALVRHRRPLVTVKLAIDRNGSVDDHASHTIASKDVEKVHELRGDCDAVLVGVETVNRDDPLLLSSLGAATRQPLLCSIPLGCKHAALLHDENETMLVQEAFSGLHLLLNRLGDREIQRILVEGGPTTIRYFLSEGLVDELYLVHGDAVHDDPVPSNIDEATLAKAQLVKSTEMVWGDERVEHFVRTLNGRKN